jgi:hypothetical protein
MSNTRLRLVLAGLTASGALAVGGVHVAEAKSVSQLGASCSQGTVASMIYLSSGSRVTVGFGSNDVRSLGTWHVVVTDNGVPTLDHTLTATVPAWTVSTNRTLTKGAHVLALTAENLSNGEVCTNSVSNKV